MLFVSAVLVPLQLLLFFVGNGETMSIVGATKGSSMAGASMTISKPDGVNSAPVPCLLPFHSSVLL